jgi:colicin import membrane protein
MARKLKVYRTHSGFFDAVVAAPSKKAAIAALGIGEREFAHGFAAVTDDPAIVAAALEHPEIVLKRQFGSKGAFKADPEPLRSPKVSAGKTAAAARNAENRAREQARKAARAELKDIDRAEKDRLADLDRREAALAEERKSVRRVFAERRAALSRQGQGAYPERRRRR